MSDDAIITLNISELADLLNRLQDENEFNQFIETHGVNVKLKIMKDYGIGKFNLIVSVYSISLNKNYSRLLEKLIENGADIGGILKDCMFDSYSVGLYTARIFLAYGVPLERDVLWRVLLGGYLSDFQETEKKVRMLLETENVYDKSLWSNIGNFFSIFVPPSKYRYTISNMTILTYVIENMI